MIVPSYVIFIKHFVKDRVLGDMPNQFHKMATEIKELAARSL